MRRTRKSLDGVHMDLEKTGLWRKVFPIFVVLLLASTASAYSMTWENPQKRSSAGQWVKGALEMNVSADENSRVTKTWFWYNTTDGYDLIDEATNDTPDQTYWTADFDTTSIEDRAVELKANSTNNESGLASGSPLLSSDTASTTTVITVDNSAPDSLTLDSPANGTIISSGFDIEASWSDEVSGVKQAKYSVSKDSTIYSVGELKNDGTDVDLTGLEDDIYHINMNATDRANNTLHKTKVASIRVDNHPPEVESSSIYPEQGSKTGKDLPSIGFNLTDFTEVDKDSVVVWLERSGGTEKHTDSSDFNILKEFDNKRKVQVEFEPDSALSEDTRYDLTFRAEDSSGHMMSNQTSWFNTNSTPPKFERYTAYGMSAERNGDRWFRENVTVQISCSSRSGSPVNSYSLSGKFGLDVQKTSSKGAVNLTFESDPGIERSINLTMRCTDEGGHSTESYLLAHLDSSSPYFNSRTPSRGEEVQNSSAQIIKIEITDNGAGLSESRVTENLNPQFNGSSVNRYTVILEEDNTTAIIEWNETIFPNRTYNIGLNSQDKYSISDLLDQTLEVGTWSFKSTINPRNKTNNNAKNATEKDIPALEFTSAPSKVEIIPGSSAMVDVGLNNTADQSSRIELSAVTDNPYLNASFVRTSINILSSEYKVLNINIESSSLFSGLALVEITLEEGESILETNFTVEAISNTRELILIPPDFVDVVAGDRTSFSFNISNRGKTVLEGLQASIDRFLGGIYPERFDLEVNETRSVRVNLSAPEDLAMGEYSQNLSVSNSRISRSREVVVRVQPSSEYVKNNISEGIENLRKNFKSSGSFPAREKVGKLLSDAEKSIEAGNYVKASEIRNKVKKLLESVEQKKEGKYLSSMTIYILIVIMVLALLSLLLYLYTFRKVFKGLKRSFRSFSNKISSLFSSEKSGKGEEDNTVKFGGSEIEDDVSLERER